MFYYQSIDAQTLELLTALQSIPVFSNMRLAGGTLLALQIGHRKSIYLYLFGRLEADESTFLQAIQQVQRLKQTSKVSLL